MSGGSEELFKRFTTELGYQDSDGFTELSGVGSHSEFNKAKSRLGIDAVYRSPNDELEDSTIVYFKKFESTPEQSLEEVYNSVWNEGKASLLIFIFPDEIKVYNPGAKPIVSAEEGIDDREERLIEILKVQNRLLEEVPQISHYERKYIDSREFWRQRQGKFKQNQRVDDYLHDDLTSLKFKLEDKLELKPEITNQIIIKSIFTKFLEDRDVLTERLREKWGVGGSLIELLPEKKSVYKLFDLINEEFNGDVFEYTSEEYQAIQRDHLEWINRFIEGEDVQTGQTRLSPYQFDIIPVELISSIYEDFVSSTRGVYYTPSYLVEHVVNDYIGESFDSTKKILDPACGSGVFLVVAFEKILQNLRKERGPLTREDVINVARENLVGVDKSSEAIQITAFSLSLKVFEHLDRSSEIESLELPNLIGESLFHSDFFDDDAPFNGEKYDLIIGNPPWIRRKNSDAISYCSDNGLPTCNNQVALAFMWKSLDLVDRDGEVCLLLPTRDVLLNTRTTKFREKFFKNANIKSIINLSILRDRIFTASNPCCIMKFNNDEIETEKVQYITPTYQYTDATQSIIVDPDDVKYLPRTETDPRFWKAAMYGDTSDFDIIRKLTEGSTIEEFVEEFGMESGEGFQLGGRDNNRDETIQTIPHLPPRDHQPYWVDDEDLVEYEEMEFHRPRSGTKIWEGPRLLIKEGVTTSNEQKFRSSYIETPVTFKHGIMAIRGDNESVPLLKALNLFLNSTLAQYYFFMTSTKWGVERAEVEKNEIMQFPFPYEELAEHLDHLVNLHEKIIRASQISNESVYHEIRQEIDDTIFEIFDITTEEKLVIQSRVENTIDYYHNKLDSHAESPPTVEDLRTYVEIVSKGLSEFLGDDEYEMSGLCYREKVGDTRFVSGNTKFQYSPLNLATFYLDAESSVEIKEARDGLSSVIRDMSERVLGERDDNIYFQRNTIIHHSSDVHVLKPNRLRFWDPAAAVNDIRWILGDLIRKGRNV